MPKTTTIKDIAKAANVSIATVSRVINQSENVTPELVERVQSAVKQLNYSPNAVARSLKNSKTAVIAFLVSNISDPFFIKIGRGIEAYIQNYGYNLMVCSIGHVKEREQDYLKLLQGKKVDGMIINTTGYNDESISALSRKIPIVLSNRRINDRSFVGDFVDQENVGDTYALTNQLLINGHKRIALVNGPDHVSTAYERYRGFCSAMREADLAIDATYPYQYSNTFTTQTGYDGARVLMSLPDPPTAFVFASSELAFGGMRYFKQKGIRVPQDISFVCIGDLANRDLLYTQPTLSSVNLHGMGERMAELLLERIQTGTPIPNREIRFSSTILQGNSIKNMI